MASLSLPRVLQLKKNSLDAEREQFEKFQVSRPQIFLTFDLVWFLFLCNISSHITDNVMNGGEWRYQYIYFCANPILQTPHYRLSKSKNMQQLKHIESNILHIKL